jgi:hypothetical protein
MITSSITFTIYVIEIMEKGDQFDVVFTDIKKSFDSVGFLIRELNLLGIGDPLLSFLRFYISDKQKLVENNDCKSPLTIN